MCFYDVEPCEVAVCKVRRARKAHKCFECGDDIAPGERYWYASGIGEGGPFDHKECRRCCYDRKRIVDHELAEGCAWYEADPGMGGLTDALTEYEWARTPKDKVPSEFSLA